MNRRRVLSILLLAAMVLGGQTSAADTAAADRLERIRSRLRAEAGAYQVPQRDEDLPMVALTVLPGDTHRRIATDLTGGTDAERILSRIEGRLRPGQQIFVPRALLSPRLADPRMEPLRLERKAPTLWSLARTRTVTRGAGIAATVRNIQRLNGVVDPTRIRADEALLIPRSLLREPVASSSPPLNIVRTYRVTDLKGLDRKPQSREFPKSLRAGLRSRGLWRRQLEPREINLVVVHTTEHRGAPLPNVARFLQRKRLANYLIDRAGTVYEIVPEEHRAFGCGQSLWEGYYVVDHEAINVEIFADTAPGKHYSGVTSAQYAGLKDLIAHIRARRPEIHAGRVVTHRMVAFSNSYGTRSRKGDPYEFDWALAGLPDNSLRIDQDVLMGRAKLCTDERYSDRITPGQTAAARMQAAM